MDFRYKIEIAIDPWASDNRRFTVYGLDDIYPCDTFSEVVDVLRKQVSDLGLDTQSVK